MAANTRTEKKSGGPFTFIKSRGSVRKELKRQHSNDEASSAPGALGRWLRELRPAASKPAAPPAAPTPQMDRTHPVYHSEGKGLRRRKDRDKRRHSFNEQQPGPLTIPPAKHAGSYRSDGQGDSACARQMAREVAPAPDVMMAAHPNNHQVQATALQAHQTQPPPTQGHQVQASLTGSKGASIYSYLQTQSGLSFAPVIHPQHWEQQPQWSRHDAGSPPPTPPVRDASSLKGVKYGPGHEKFPSWPMSAAADPTPPGGGSHRSKSWTDHTNYPKEEGIPYTRPYMKRPNPAFTQQQLKTVVERCEKMSPEALESRGRLPRLDREGRPLGDADYAAPSPPERDLELPGPRLTRADLEEYSRTYEPPHQPPYAQSEGYHSYVSSADSSMATPFLDRLRRDSEATRAAPGPQPPDPGREETLKWLGSTGGIAHSARVQTPQRHNSESVLFPAQRNNKLRLFPVNTYAVRPEPQPSVAERVNELERRQTRYSYLDPDKRHRVSDPTLKAIQKKALLSFYERHHQGAACWRSEPQLLAPPPRPPPRPRSNQASRRASSASDYAGGGWRDKGADKTEPVGTLRDGARHQHSNSCGSLSTDLLGPLIVGPTISLDDWVPERPPKKPHLRSAFPPPLPDRTVSPDLPPPSPPTVLEDEVFASDEPLPPPPPEVNSDWSQVHVERQQERLPSILKHGERPLDSGGSKRLENNESPPQRQVENGVDRVYNGNGSDDPKSPSLSPTFASPFKTAALPRKPTQSPRKCPPPPKTSPTSPNSRNMNQTFARTLSMKRLDNVPQNNINCGVPPMNLVEKNWSALKYQTQKLMVNGKIATSFPVRDSAERIEHRNGSILQPSKARLQRIPAEMHNGALQSRSPPHSTAIIKPNLNQSLESRKLSQRSPSEEGRAGPSPIDRLNSDDNGRQRSAPTRLEPSPPYERLNSDDNGRQRSPPTRLEPSPSYERLNSNDNGRQSSPPTRLEPSPPNERLNSDDNGRQRSAPTRLEPSPHYERLHSNDNGRQSSPPTRLEPSPPNEWLNSDDSGRQRSAPTRLEPSPPNERLNSDDSGRQRSPTTRLEPSPPYDRLNSTMNDRQRSPTLLPEERLKSDDNGRQRSPPSRFLRSQSSSPPSLPNERLNSYESDRRRSPPMRLELLASSPPLPDERLHSEERERQQSPPSRLEPEENTKEDVLATSHQGSNDQLSTSKASYLAYRRDRDRDGPNFEGSYKRTMSPSEAGLDNHKQTDCDRLASTAAEGPHSEGKLSPSHHDQRRAMIKERIIITPSTIDKVVHRVATTNNKQCFKVESVCLDSDVVHRVATTNNKQCFKVESVCLDSDVVHRVATTNNKQCFKVESVCLDSDVVDVEETSRVLIPLRGIEIQTQCDIVNESVPSPPRSPLFESLTLVERSEVVLHVNAATSDASSQTEREATVSVLPSTQVRQKLQEEIECERLSLDLASQLSPFDKLQGILVPAPERKKPADYVAGLFRLEVGGRLRGGASNPEAERGGEPLPSSSVYYTTSESKAKFLTRFNKEDMSGRSEQLGGGSAELQQKKEELMSRLARKLEVLRDERVTVADESAVNERLGDAVATRVAQLARPHESAKYRLHVEEVGKITSLLLGLSGRLARVDNALVGMPELHAERKILESKRDKLQEQLEEAKKLKENIDRRSVFVSNILYKYFNSEEYADYDHFINMKAKLIMESREIIDKIKLGEEQLVALRETLSSPES